MSFETMDTSLLPKTDLNQKSFVNSLNCEMLLRCEVWKEPLSKACTLVLKRMEIISVRT